MLSIAITGGIGSGKSTVTSYLTEKGYIVIDADRMARELTAPGGRSIPYILENFGENYIAEDGSMDRAAMRDLVFTDPEKKKILEKGTTQVVLEDIAKIRERAENDGTKVMFFDIPLLYETQEHDEYDYVWVVTADRELRKQRVMKRDNIDEKIIELIIGTQAEEEHKLALCDEAIINNGSIEELYKKIDELLEKLDILSLMTAEKYL